MDQIKVQTKIMISSITAGSVNIHELICGFFFGILKNSSFIKRIPRKKQLDMDEVRDSSK